VQQQDTARDESFNHIRKRERHFQTYIWNIVTPAMSLLEALWEHVRVPEETKGKFSGPGFIRDREGYLVVSRERERLQNIAAVAGADILRYVSLRETYRRNLIGLAQNELLRRTENVPFFEAEALAMQIHNAVLLLRHVTCQIVDAVFEERKHCDVVEPEPLKFEGKNYMVTMRNDLQRLEHTPLMAVLRHSIPSDNNPMLLPSDLHGTSISALENSDAVRVSLVSHTAADMAVQRLRATKNVKTPRQMRAERTRPTTVACGTPTSFCRTHPAEPAIPSLSTPGTVPLTREAYFKRLEKEKLLRPGRVSMDRSNVYQYPPEVHRTETRSVWSRVGEMLIRSLDPRLKPKPYDDVLEFERLQFGRLCVPPNFHKPWNNPVIDEGTKCFRSVIHQVPQYSFNELLQREILMFSEEAYLQGRSAKKKFRRAIEKLRIAHVAFTKTLWRHRAMKEKDRGLVEFLQWVRDNAPQWIDEAKQGLTGDDDELLRLIFLDAEE
jgi:hypothetical protein